MLVMMQASTENVDVVHYYPEEVQAQSSSAFQTALEHRFCTSLACAAPSDMLTLSATLAATMSIQLAQASVFKLNLWQLFKRFDVCMW